LKFRKSVEMRARAVLSKAGIEMLFLRNRARRYGGVEFTWGKPDPAHVRGGVCEFIHDGKCVRFFVASDTDDIGRFHRLGHFYEPEELAIIAAHYRGGVFVDVGANVGNHAVFAALFLGAPRVIAVEPNPPAGKILEINIMLNGLGERITHLPIGFGRGAAMARAETLNHNLGETLMVLDEAGPITILPGDDVLDEDIGFVKIDTEGSELDVIAGLAGTIARCKPIMFVEVIGDGDGFRAVLDRIGYRITDSFERYAGTVNYLVEPVIA
jgi:FkbM family methyltransferase